MMKTSTPSMTIIVATPRRIRWLSRATAGSMAIAASIDMMRVKITLPPSLMTKLAEGRQRDDGDEHPAGAPHVAPVEVDDDVGRARGSDATPAGAAGRPRAGSSTAATAWAPRRDRSWPRSSQSAGAWQREITHASADFVSAGPTV